jgi:hypothetical protein
LGTCSEGNLEAFPTGEDAVNPSRSFENGERSPLPFLLLRDELRLGSGMRRDGMAGRPEANELAETAVGLGVDENGVIRDEGEHKTGRRTGRLRKEIVGFWPFGDVGGVAWSGDPVNGESGRCQASRSRKR